MPVALKKCSHNLRHSSDDAVEHCLVKKYYNNRPTDEIRLNWNLRYWTCQNLLSTWDVEPASRKDFVQPGMIAYSVAATLLGLEQALLPLGKILAKVQSNPVTVNIVDINTLYISF